MTGVGGRGRGTSAPRPRPCYTIFVAVWNEREIERRRGLAPKVGYPPELPVAERRAEITAAIESNPVIVLTGETGSGKTTQLPKICLELGRGVRGMIGHTQPRRIAARSVAQRIADELGVPLGGVVGSKVRFGDETGPDTLIKLMTDGILLAETQSDRWLERYDTIILDEAHERGLNIDFLLGYLKQLLPRRPDMKLIVTSATIDPGRFSRHFGDCPIIEVSGRMYPVEARYRPLTGAGDDEEDLHQLDGIVAAVRELWRESPGDTLIFLAGEREIRETAEVLNESGFAEAEIIPLYARLGAGEQRRIFQPHSRRRIILATNVAETSLTVPGIRYVIDPGTARISRYSPRTKVQRLPIEAISQASADQRKGRCGRIGPGVCVRLYSEEDYLAREAFTPPEILRTNLASVILQMMSLRLGRVDAFPFVEPPDYRMIRDGYQTLHELGAIDADNELTGIGRDLARLPTDPRIARMILAARHEGAMDEVLVIAAALSVQDPRDRPMDQRQQADEAHKQFADPKSDFVTYLRLWRAYQERAEHLSGSQLRKWCHANFLSYMRMREWVEVWRQIGAVVARRR